MIQLHRCALIVCHGDGRIEPLNIEDLVEHLKTDSEFAVNGVEPWVFERVIECVIRHIRDDLQCERVSLSELMDLIRGLLKSYFKEFIQREQGLFRLDLFETALLCGIGFELEFFARIRHFLMEKACPARVKMDTPGLPGHEQSLSFGTIEKKDGLFFQFTGLRCCVKFLSGRRRWSKCCFETRDEILAFIRAETARISTRNLTVTVLS